MKTPTWIFWIIAHIIGYPVALMIGFIAIHLFAFVGNLLPEIIASGLGYILWGGIVGGLIGLFQWYFLKRFQIPSGWIWKSALGFAIAETLMVLVLLSLGIDRNIDLVFSFGMQIWTLTYFLGGGITGFLQSAYLKNNSGQYRYWTVVNALIWGMSTFLWTLFISLQIGGNFAVLLGGLGVGVLSAIGLSLFLKKVPDSKI